MSVRCPSCSFTFKQTSDRVDKWAACPKCGAAIPPVYTKPFRPLRAVVITALAVVVPLTLVKLLLPAKEVPPPPPQTVITPAKPEMSQRTKDTLAMLDQLAEQDKELERMKKGAARQERVSEAERARLH
jgi:hypothetical protein